MIKREDCKFHKICNMDCEKCIQQQERIKILIRPCAFFENYKGGKKPKCPSCKSIMVKIYYSNAPNQRAHIGFFCRKCRAYKMYPNLRAII